MRTTLVLSLLCAVAWVSPASADVDPALLAETAPEVLWSSPDEPDLQAKATELATPVAILVDVDHTDRGPRSVVALQLARLWRHSHPRANLAPVLGRGGCLAISSSPPDRGSR